jgi:isochorismate synthase EntC
MTDVSAVRIRPIAPHCSSMNVPETPFVLHLPNVMHLATDVTGVVHDAGRVSSLELAAAKFVPVVDALGE